MSRKLLVPYLTEWLINHGTEPIPLDKMGLFLMEHHYKALRLGYIEHVGKQIRLTPVGVEYIKRYTR